MVVVHVMMIVMTVATAVFDGLKLLATLMRLSTVLTVPLYCLA